MEAPKKEDILLLADEKFDFDLSLSSSSANEDDEVFFGPIGHKERCIAASLELNNQIPEEPPLPTSERHFTWSPLTGEKFVEVYKEAHLLAFQIQSNGRTKAAQASQPEDPGSQGVEGFIQESKLKINLFDRENEVKKSPKSLKRETYCLSDGLWRAPLLRGSQPSSSAAPPAAPAQTSCPETLGLPPSSCPSLLAEPGAAPPSNQAGAQKKVTSKLLPPRTLSLRGKSLHSVVEKPAKEKPASPPRMKIQNEKDAHSSMPLDKPSTTRDVATVPASGSHLVPGKRSLPVPNKFGPKKTILKPPGCAGGLAGRSLSGSVSGLSSAACASPAAGRAKPSERPGISVDSARSSSSQTGRMGLALPRPSLKAGPGGVACRQSQRPGAAEWTAEQPRGPPRAALPQPQTPEQGGPGLSSLCGLSQSSQRDKTGSTRRRDSCLNSKTKAVPTPTNQFKIPRFSTGEPPDGVTPKSCRAQRPQSCTSVGRVAHSTPVRWSSATQSLTSSVRTPVSMRRLSALPTPSGRRLSSLPPATPMTVPRLLASPLPSSARRLSSEFQKKSTVRTVPAREGDSQPVFRCPDLSPDSSCSPPSAVPQALDFSPEKSDFTFSQSITAEVTLDEAQPPEATAPSEALLVDLKLDQLSLTGEAAATALDNRPLIDFCKSPEAVTALRSGSGPLVDLLTNTPEANRKAVAKPPDEVGQLIDLASPLILLSPEADKENMESPLLKF
ncbi:G2 and S phase-expressed protein 1 isoform X1 [Moschus berezovskii]|uniref:G2 and S phase-expressed protein 1 isoform X1 n=1 Tax=Moschus berezovskii TaxID=68408 RepID=UPI002444F433|nr:G2 and S phase-expressed protein 1 isoform X1 [Moschus berezovskii]